MTDWYERTIKALQLNGKGERTQQLYARAVRMLSEFYEKTPDLVSEMTKSAPSVRRMAILDNIKAEGMGKVKRKSTRKVKLPVKYCLSKNGTALPSPFQAACSATFRLNMLWSNSRV